MDHVENTALLLLQMRVYRPLRSNCRGADHRKRRFQEFLCCCVLIRRRGNVFTEQLRRNGSTFYNIYMRARVCMCMKKLHLTPIQLNYLISSQQLNFYIILTRPPKYAKIYLSLRFLTIILQVELLPALYATFLGKKNVWRCDDPITGVCKHSSETSWSVFLTICSRVRWTPHLLQPTNSGSNPPNPLLFLSRVINGFARARIYLREYCV
jgi:hypothetical protein